jgi:hypothetical protein
VSLDAVGHGERRRADFDAIFNPERWDADFEATEIDFLQLIDDTAAEVPSIIDDLLARGWARQDRIGICGRSLGRGTQPSPAGSSTSSMPAWGISSRPRCRRELPTAW